MGEHGQGTRVPIRTPRKDGTYRERIRVAVTMPGGKRVWRTVRNDREADRVQGRLVQARVLELDPTSQTLEAYLASWVRSQREKRARGRGLREGTLIEYERIIDQRIVPQLGKVRVEALTRRRIQAWVDAADGAPRTVRNAHALLRKALAGAVGEFFPVNPAVGVELDEGPRYTGRPLTAVEAHRLLEATRGARLHPLWRLAIVTGLREAELLGLPRDALEGDVLAVAGQLQRIRGQWVREAVKPGRKIDRLALDRETVAVLRAHLAAMALERQPGWRFHGLMFVTEKGEPYHEAQIRREFRAACELVGIPPRRFHDLRHTSNRLLKDADVDREVRKARLGHSTDEMSEHYGGASAVRDRAAVELLAEAIG